MRLKLCLAMEKLLEVEKLHEAEQAANQSSEADAIYQQTKTNLEQEEEVPPEPVEAPPEASTEETPATPPDEATTSPETSPPAAGEEGTTPPEKKPTEDTPAKKEPEEEKPETNEALESFVADHQRTIVALLGLEHFTAAFESDFTDGLKNAAMTMGGLTKNGLAYIKELGFEYGPILLKHVYKGVLIALDNTTRALVKGGVMIADYIKRRMESYTVFKKSIGQLRSALELLQKAAEERPPKTDEVENTDVFRNAKIISQLKTSSSVDFRANVDIAKEFLQSYFSYVGKNVETNVRGIEYMIDAVMKTNIKLASSAMQDSVTFPGFVLKTIPGYTPTSSLCDSYVYSKVLPGDVTLVGYLPKKHLTHEDQVVEAYQHSTLFMGFNQRTMAMPESVPYPTLPEIGEYLNTLDQLCDVGISHAKVFERIIEQRDNVEKALKRYLQFLVEAKNKIAIKEALTEYLALKIGFLDKTYVAGAIHIHDYMVRLLTASLTYCKEAIKVVE